MGKKYDEASQKLNKNIEFMAQNTLTMDWLTRCAELASISSEYTQGIRIIYSLDLDVSASILISVHFVVGTNFIARDVCKLPDKSIFTIAEYKQLCEGATEIIMNRFTELGLCPTLKDLSVLTYGDNSQIDCAKAIIRINPLY